MDVVVFIGLGAAAGVIVLLFAVTGLIRAMRDEDDDLAARRGLALRPNVARRSNGRAEQPSATRDSALVERVQAHAPPDVPNVLSGVPEGRADDPEARNVATTLAQVSTSAIPSKRGDPVKLSRRSKDDQAREGEDAAKEGAGMANVKPRENAGEGLGDYARLGEQVTAVLTSAEHAAADIREAANREAEEVRLAAENKVAVAKADAERIRTEAEAYRDEIKGAADSYADERRRSTEAAAANARADAEEKARAVEANARRKANEIEAEALRRRDALRQSASDLEERIQTMLGTFRMMTADLEGLLPGDDKRRSGKSGENADDVVDDTLEDALKPERVT